MKKAFKSMAFLISIVGIAVGCTHFFLYQNAYPELTRAEVIIDLWKTLALVIGCIIFAGISLKEEKD